MFSQSEIGLKQVDIVAQAVIVAARFGFGHHGDVSTRRCRAHDRLMYLALFLHGVGFGEMFQMLARVVRMFIGV